VTVFHDAPFNCQGGVGDVCYTISLTRHTKSAYNLR